MYRYALLLICVVLVAGSALADAPPTINELRTGVVGVGTVVDVQNGVVTAVAPSGFAINDVETTEYHDIWVHTGTAPVDDQGTLIEVGDVVQLFDASFIDDAGWAVLDMTAVPGTIVYTTDVATARPITTLSPQDLLAGPEGWESAPVQLIGHFYITIEEATGGWRTRTHPGYLDIPFSGLWYDTGDVQAMDCFEDPIGILTFEEGEYRVAPYHGGINFVDCNTPGETVSFAHVKSIYR